MRANESLGPLTYSIFLGPRKIKKMTTKPRRGGRTAAADDGRGKKEGKVGATVAARSTPLIVFGPSERERERKKAFPFLVRNKRRGARLPCGPSIKARTQRESERKRKS